MNRFYVMLCLVVGWQTATAQPLTPAQIFAKTIAVYESAATYQDTGEAVTSIKQGNAAWYEPETITFRTTFQTAFIRQAAQYTLRYTRLPYSGRSEKCSLIWARGAETKTWLDIHKKIETPARLEDALGLSWGVPAEAVKRVYSLLMNTSSSDWGLNELKDISVLPPDKVLNRSCYHLRGTLNRDVFGHVTAKAPRPIKGPTERHPAIEVWIDATTFLILRVTEAYNQGVDYRSKTINYQPVLNQPVKPEALAFDYKNCQ
ncbi:MAG: hypothetical protein H7Z72_01775 [Bacteroidetes bacterium]|nr:hypothetical protein [Fibrella sp.]